MLLSFRSDLYRVGVGNHVGVAEFLTTFNSGCLPTPAWKGQGCRGSCDLAL